MISDVMMVLIGIVVVLIGAAVVGNQILLVRTLKKLDDPRVLTTLEQSYANASPNVKSLLELIESLTQFSYNSIPLDALPGLKEALKQVGKTLEEVSDGVPVLDKEK